MIKPEEYELWLRDPVTQALRAHAAEELGRLKDMWATGQLGSDPVKVEYVRGQCTILQQYIDLEVIALEKEE